MRTQIICLAASICLITGSSARGAILYGSVLLSADIVQIDTTTGEILPVIHRPLAAGGYTGLAYAPSRNSLFYSDSTGIDGLFEFDAETGALKNFMSDRNLRSDGLAFDAGYLFLNNGGILKLNLESGASTTLPVAEGGLRALDAANGRLFSASRDGIVEISETTGSIINSFAAPEGEPVVGLGFDGVSLFVAPGPTRGKIYELNPDTGALIRTITLDASLAFDALAAIPIPDPATLAISLAGLTLLCRRRRI